MPDFLILSFEELNDLILSEAHNQLHLLFLNRFFIFLGIYQLKQAKSYTVEHLAAMENMQLGLESIVLTSLKLKCNL